MKKLNIKTLDIIIYCCIIWKTICPFLGFAYIVGWLTMIFEDPMFKIIDDGIGWLPSHIDALFLQQTSLFGENYPMGYIYSAMLTIISMYIVFRFQIYVNDCKMIKENETKKIDIKKVQEINKTSLKQIDDTYKYTHFFALLELKLEYINNTDKSQEELIKLRDEYLKMAVNKLNAKYTNVKFQQNDKVFIISDDFLIFDPFLLDISKLHKIFVDLDNPKGIKTELLLSFCCGSENNNFQFIEQLLQKVNDLKYINKVIAINEFEAKYKAIKANQFKFISLGLSRIEVTKDKEVDVDLFYLKKN